MPFRISLPIAASPVIARMKPQWETTRVSRHSGSAAYVETRVLTELFELPIRLVTGYSGTNDQVSLGGSAVYLDSWADDWSKMLFFVEGGQYAERYFLFDRLLTIGEDLGQLLRAHCGFRSRGRRRRHRRDPDPPHR